MNRLFKFVPSAICLVAVLFLSYFWRFQEFGFYEDDFGMVTLEGRRPLVKLLPSLIGQMTKWFVGRPIGTNLLQLLASFGFYLGDRPGLYLLGFSLTTLTVLLLYTLLLRRFSPLTAFLSSLIFILFPADTTKAFLCHMFQLHSALIFLLVALHLYLSNRKKLAFFSAILGLLTYESVYPLFALAPLWAARERRPTLRLFASHLGWMAFIFLATLGHRFELGDHRLHSVVETDGGWAQILEKTLASMVIGPWTSLRTFFQAPGWVWQEWLQVNIWIFPCVVALIAATLYFIEQKQIGPLRSERRDLRQIFWLSLAAIPLSYCLSITHYPPTQIMGRGTSVHLAAGLTVSILLGGLLAGLLARLQRWAWMAGSFALALYFGVLSGYGTVIQNQFVQARIEQQRFWAQLVTAAPDLTPSTLVMVVRRGPEPARAIRANAGTMMSTVLRQVYAFPETWDGIPRVSLVPPDWFMKPKAMEKIYADTYFPRDRATIDLDAAIGDLRLIWLSEEADGNLVRYAGEIRLAGRTLSFVPRGQDTLSELPHYPLYDYLIAPGMSDLRKRTLAMTSESQSAAFSALH